MEPATQSILTTAHDPIASLSAGVPADSYFPTHRGHFLRAELAISDLSVPFLCSCGATLTKTLVDYLAYDTKHPQLGSPPVCPPIHIPWGAYPMSVGPEWSGRPTDKNAPLLLICRFLVEEEAVRGLPNLFAGQLRRALAIGQRPCPVWPPVVHPLVWRGESRFSCCAVLEVHGVSASAVPLLDLLATAPVWQAPSGGACQTLMPPAELMAVPADPLVLNLPGPEPERLPYLAALRSAAVLAGRKPAILVPEDWEPTERWAMPECPACRCVSGLSSQTMTGQVPSELRCKRCHFAYNGGWPMARAGDGPFVLVLE